jgi:hypothetical protein
MPEKGWAHEKYKISAGKLHERKTLGRLRCRWDDCEGKERTVHLFYCYR